jgi:hypothetical protein
MSKSATIPPANHQRNEGPRCSASPLTYEERIVAFIDVLDEIGATIGPLFIALVLQLRGNYQTGYALLAVPALLALAALAVARVRFPLPPRLEQGQTASARAFTSSYWLYMFAGALFAAGLMSFEFISYHLSMTRVVVGYWIPVLLAIATAFGGFITPDMVLAG